MIEILIHSPYSPYIASFKFQQRYVNTVNLASI